MTKLGPFAFVLATSSLIPAARAQPAQQSASSSPAAGPARETADPADLSTINEQLVPIGEHNEYRHSFKRWNVSANPLGWVFGLYGASVSYGVGQNLAVRADINYFNDPDDAFGDTTGLEVGLGAPIYFRRTYQGAFLEPGVIVRRESNEYDGDSHDATIAGPQVLVGWHWTWDSGLNVAAAVGAGRNWSSDRDDEGEIFGNAYLRFGYAF